MIPSFRHNSYDERLSKLGWKSLEERRKRGDLIQLHKIKVTARKGRHLSMVTSEMDLTARLATL